jgi:hypothetical protein
MKAAAVRSKSIPSAPALDDLIGSVGQCVKLSKVIIDTPPDTQCQDP